MNDIVTAIEMLKEGNTAEMVADRTNVDLDIVKKLEENLLMTV